MTAPGWDAFTLYTSGVVEGSYEGEASRTREGVLEVVQLRFRFAGTASFPYLEYETWYRRSGQDGTIYASGSLFHRP